MTAYVDVAEIGGPDAVVSDDIQLRIELKAKRLLAGLTQQQAADIVGRSCRAYQYWECVGPRRTKVDTFRAAVLLSYINQLLVGA